MLQSSSLSDLHGFNGQQRIRRKPPPTIHLEERYPTPDPSDPFAPLWVLRNRTSSALGHAGPYAASYGSQDTLDILNERKVIYSSPNNTTLVEQQLDDISFPISPSPKSKSSSITGHITPWTLVGQDAGHKDTYISPNNTTLIEQQLEDLSFPASPVPRSKSRLRDAHNYGSSWMLADQDASLSSTSKRRSEAHKIGHYTPHSQTHAVGSMQAFPCLRTPHTSQINILNLESPRPAELLDESDGSTMSEFIFRPNTTPVRVLSTAPSSYKPDASLQTRTKYSSTETTSISTAARARQRIAKFLLPKKRSSLMNPVSASQAASRPQHQRHGTAPLPIVINIGSVPGATGVENKSRAARLMHRSLSEAKPSTTRASVSLEHARDLNQAATGSRLFPENKRNVEGIKHIVDNGENAAVDHQEHGDSIPGTCASSDLLSLGMNGHEYYLMHERALEAVNSVVPFAESPSVSFDLPLSPNKPIATGGIMMSVAATPIPREVNAGGGRKVLKARRSRLSSAPLPLSIPDITPVVNISTPEPAPSFMLQTMSEDAFASPRPAPTPPPHGPLLFRAAIPTLKAKSKPKSVDICETDRCGAPPNDTRPSVSSAAPSVSVAAASSPSEWAFPSASQLARAADLPVTCEDGTRVRFGSLFAAHRTVVVFIRHFWCHLCQDYMSSLRALVRPDMLSRGLSPESMNVAAAIGGDAGDAEAEAAADLSKRLVSFVVIGNGAHGMIRKYRQMFGLPFYVYTDPELAVYKALGMGRDRHDGHRHLEPQVPRPVGRSSSVLDILRHHEGQNKTKQSGYVKHGLVGGIAMVVVRAIKVGMPVWEKGGDVGQLGGEFIFGPGLTCSFAHRMQNTKGHAPIEEVLQAAGVDLSNPPPVQRDIESIEMQSSSSSNDLVFPLREISGRRRHESMRTVKETALGQKRATVIRAGDERRYSMGVMTPEEEAAWMAKRQRELDELAARKEARRGAPRPASAQASYMDSAPAAVDSVQVLEALGEVTENTVPEVQRDSFDSSGADADDEDTPEEKMRSEKLMEEIRRRLRTMSQTRRSYSTASGDDERDSIYTDSDTDDESSKDNERLPMGAGKPYLFIH